MPGVCVSTSTPLTPLVERVWGVWAEWGACSGGCGQEGTRTRVRPAVSEEGVSVSQEQCQGQCDQQDINDVEPQGQVFRPFFSDW